MIESVIARGPSVWIPPPSAAARLPSTVERVMVTDAEKLSMPAPYVARLARIAVDDDQGATAVIQDSTAVREPSLPQSHVASHHRALEA